MSDNRLFRTVSLPYCQAVMLESWDAPRGRFFVAYRARRGFTALLGNGVVDEFRTLSGPILLSPSALLGSIYDAGMRLAESRHLEAPIDTGWPPLTIGIDAATPTLLPGWQDEMLDAIRAIQSRGSVPWASNRQSDAIDGLSIDVLRCSQAGESVATVIITSIPLLPAQLERLADMDAAPVTVAVSTGNRLPHIEAGELHQVDVVSEARLGTIAAKLRLLLRG